MDPEGGGGGGWRWGELVQLGPIVSPGRSVGHSVKYPLTEFSGSAHVTASKVRVKGLISNTVP